MSPIVIIGSGLAGYSLAREIRKRDGTVPLTLVTADGGEVYAKPNLSNALAQRRDPGQLASETAEQVALRLNATILTHTRITAIDRAGKRLLSDGGEIPYGRLVLALGADPIPHGLGGDGTDRVHAVNDLDDYARFRAALVGKKRVAIIGGGLIGCEFANDLVATGHTVEVVQYGPWPLDRLVPEQVGLALASGLAQRGVVWHFGRSAKNIELAGEGVTLALDDGHRVEADLVLSAIGLRSRTAMAEAAGLAVNRGIVVDRQLRSSDPDIHAMGDCAEVEGLVLPFVQPLLAQARTLAAVLAGEEAAIVYPAMPVVVKTPASPLVVAPPPMGTAGSWQIEATDKGLIARYLDSESNLLGFALGGGETGQRLQFAQQLPAMLA
ncbi:MAG: FAD-dependent oxidoreductase [Gallionellaceae bacterium]|nr:FAD-dependent oxidoreductase [Gallionellaceae bacterium]